MKPKTELPGATVTWRDIPEREPSVEGELPGVKVQWYDGPTRDHVVLIIPPDDEHVVSLLP